MKVNNATLNIKLVQRRALEKAVEKAKNEARNGDYVDRLADLRALNKEIQRLYGK